MLIRPSELFNLAQKLLGDTERPEQEAKLLLSYFFNSSIGELYTKQYLSVDREALAHFAQKRLAKEPWAYIFGWKEFRDIQLKVPRGLFIPRQETELLTERAIKTISLLLPHSPLSVLDLGTGVGNIAISLSKAFPHLSLLSTDICPLALQTAISNAQRYNLTNISFLLSDLFKNIPPNKKFHLIVSNPPYIPEDKLDDLPEEVKKEPKRALNGGEKGVSILREIIETAPHFLIPGGYLLLEIGLSQEKLLKKPILKSKLILKDIVKDYAGIPRIMILRKNGKDNY